VDKSDQLLAVLKADKTAAAAEALRTGTPVSEYVFTSKNRKPFESSWVRKIFSNPLKTSGLRAVPFHALRHSCASALIANEASLTYVKGQMGHHSINVTVDVYGHLILSANRAEVNKLDDEKLLKSATQTQPEKNRIESS